MTALSRTTWLARGLAVALALLPAAGRCGDPPAPPLPSVAPAPATDAAASAGADTAVPQAGTRNGLEIYARFHEGLADPDCPVDSSSARWRKHFARAPERFGEPDDDTLALFGYVVDALREASLPTEYALIPFVESGYRPGARSPNGPAGMWQFITVPNSEERVGDAVIRAHAGVRVSDTRALGAVKHALTHRRYAFEVFHACAVSDEVVERNGHTPKWLTVEEMDQVPLPRPHLKIARMAGCGLGGNSPKLR